jgi:hypothetical protein
MPHDVELSDVHASIRHPGASGNSDEAPGTTHIGLDHGEGTGDSNLTLARLSKWSRCSDYAKKHVPSFVTLVSVILNLVILSLLIPNMRSDLRYMQGQVRANAAG